MEFGDELQFRFLDEEEITENVVKGGKFNFVQNVRQLLHKKLWHGVNNIQNSFLSDSHVFPLPAGSTDHSSIDHVWNVIGKRLGQLFKSTSQYSCSKSHFQVFYKILQQRRKQVDKCIGVYCICFQIYHFMVFHLLPFQCLYTFHIFSCVDVRVIVMTRRRG